MTIAKNGDTVAIDFEVSTKDGRVVGGTKDQGPQVVKIGEAQIFPQIEEALTGMEVGAQTDVVVPAENAFGERRDDMIVDIPRSSLPPEPKPEPGMSLSARQPDGNEMNLVITEVGEETVKADGNHPLAGEDLTFGVTLVEVKEAA